MNTNVKKQGFSMIEVLVATSILIVLVMMLAMLFQQSSVVWRTGLLRARGYMQLRAYIGAIQRDASAAIDAQNIPAGLLKGPQSFSASELKFYTMTGGENNRTLSFITHKIDGTRTQSVLGQSGWGIEESSQVLEFITANSANDPTISPSKFEFEWESGGSATDFPLLIRVGAQIVQKGTLYQVGAASAGPDTKWNTSDDIRTWVQ